MQKAPVIIVGKLVRQIARLRGGGSALPGLIVERLDPTFLPWALNKLPGGVILISGTNGKTTSTKIVVELLKSQGLKVFTNKSGSNFIRGVIASLLEQISINGTLDADIAVLELDEAHAVKFVNIVKPRYSLLLNVMRDQLDRFGEIDTTARLLSTIAEATTDTVVINREDARLRTIGMRLTNSVYYGLSDHVRQSFPSDDDLYANTQSEPHPDLPAADVVLADANDNRASFLIGDVPHDATLALRGSYNLFNAAGALALVRAVRGTDLQVGPLFERLKTITPAFGRGETLSVNGHPFELILIKNPGGFRLALSSFSPYGHSTMIAINDDYADGRDVSWLWDVDYDSLRTYGVAMVSGVRAYDMALRLKFDDITFTTVETDLAKAVAAFVATSPDMPKRVYCTYTAMLKIRKLMSTYTIVEKAL